MRVAAIIAVVVASTACNSYEQLCKVICNAPARCSSVGGFLPACGDACQQSTDELKAAGCEDKGHDVVGCLNDSNLCKPNPDYCASQVEKVTACIQPYCDKHADASICDPGSQCVQLHGSLQELCP